jgi:hypothetical protein
MNYFSAISVYPDRTIIAAWNSQVKEVESTPELADAVTQGGLDLFSRFACCYAELRRLPRSSRRALQRHVAQSDLPLAYSPEWLRSNARRSLMRNLSRTLAGAALLLALLHGVPQAATITVDTADPRVLPDGQCSLVEAIFNANTDAVVSADCPPGSGPDLIVLPPNATLRLRAVYDDAYGPTGLPLITTQITIEGNGARLHARGGGARFRLIAVASSGELTLQNATLTNGSSTNGGAVLNNGTATILNSTITKNSASLGGGVLNQGTLLIQDSAISGNSANIGGGVSNGGFVAIGNNANSQNSRRTGPHCFSNYSYYSFYYYGPLSCYYLYSGDLTILSTSISKNSANSGAGLGNYLGAVAVGSSIITGNRGSLGAGVFNSGGSFDYDSNYISAGNLSLSNSTVSRNIGNNGGGVFNGGNISIESSTISGNKASNDGGGIFNANNGSAPDGSVSLLDSTISGNTAKDSGGGLANYGSLAISNSVISGNRARFGSDIFP